LPFPKILLAALVGLGLIALASEGRAQAPSAPPAADAKAPPATAPAAGGAATPAAEAPPPALTLPPEALEPVQRLAKSVENAEKAIQQLRELEGELARLRSEVERIIYDSTSTAEQLRPQLDEVRKQIDRLGPPPGKDQPPESATVIAERQRLNQLAASLDGAIKTTELAWVRAKQLIDRITVIRYQLFTRNLFERRDSPLLPAVWRDVGDRLPLVMSRLSYYGNDWLTWASRKSGWLALLGAGTVLAFGLLSWLSRRLLARCRARPEATPTFFQRVTQGARLLPLHMVAAVVAVLMIYFGLAALDLLFAPWIGVANAALGGLFIYVAAAALLEVCLAPAYPAWRIVPVADRTARNVKLALEAMVAVFVVDVVLVELARALYVPLSINVVKTFLFSVVFVTILAALFLVRIEPLIGPDRPVNGHAFVPKPVTLLTPAWMKLPVAATAIAILVASLAGYIALGRFIAHQVVLSGTVLAGAGLLYLAIRAVTRDRADNRDLVGIFLERRFGFSDPLRRRQLSRLVEVIGTLLVFTLAVPALLVQWGFSAADIRDWFLALLFGFEIGRYRVSLVSILVGIALFTVLLFTTRLVQRWLREKVLVAPRVDPGIANSVETAVGYAGIGLALLVALSWAGLDITSLAIVAGALSVGIGFGLQSIVNNFVSGLILLVERPVKVGDWIVVGNEQGNVRRISVRSTEIETFDRASLIIPNSELITGRVLNWTHRNPLGRAVVKVETAPFADPQAVIAILHECAIQHPDTVKTPAPFITFDSFSSLKLEFTVRAVVPDVYLGGKVGTDMRIEILKRLREKGISLGNPQYDVHLRDLDWVKSAAARVAEQRNNGADPGNQPTGAETGAERS
jgi:small-conductance mechanosensitive channel